MQHNNKLMHIASEKLKPVHSYQDGLQIYFLTGEKYLYQTLFCIASLTKHSEEKFNFILIDDGTFNEPLLETINRLLPNATIYLNSDIEANLSKLLPEQQFKKLRNKRSTYPHIRKLTDIHTLNRQEWKLVLDSDMLFYKNPEEIINWLKTPKTPIHMVDCEESYGYSSNLMETLAGAEIPELLNVGVIGLNSNTIDWNNIENWISILEKEEGETYFLEQAISAMIVAKENSIALSPIKYVVNPVEDNKMSPACLHHYVSTSKKKYFNEAWKEFL